MNILALPGDGIGPEITAVAVQALERLDKRFALGLHFETRDVGLASLKKSGTTFPDAVQAACRAADGIVLGPVSHHDYPPRAQGGLNPSGDLRIALDLYANIRPSKCYEGIPHYGRTPMDLVIVRENTEGFYADRNMHQGIAEFMPTPDLALSVRKISAHASRRIAQAAFRLARRRRCKVTAVHKINVLKMTEALFLREVRNVAQEYKDVAYEEQLVDSMAATGRGLLPVALGSGIMWLVGDWTVFKFETYRISTDLRREYASTYRTYHNSYVIQYVLL